MQMYLIILFNILIDKISTKQYGSTGRISFGK